MKCKQFKPVDQFYNNKSARYGLHNYCHECHKVKRAKTKKRDLAAINKRNRRLAAYFNQLGGGACQRCGFSSYIPAMDFHHVNRAEKEHNPQTIINSGNMEKAKAEIDKCVILCANCHRAYEAGLWRCEFVKRKEGIGWTIKRGSIVETKHDDIDELPARYKYTQLGLL
jgi:hypothetical protein